MDYADLADLEIEHTLRDCLEKASSREEVKATHCKNCEEKLTATSLGNYCDAACAHDHSRREHLKNIGGKRR